MPFIDVKLSESLETEKIESVKTELGKAIPLLPGKSENYLMVNIEPECHLYAVSACLAKRRARLVRHSQRKFVIF